MNNEKVIYSPLSYPKVLDKAEKHPSQILPETPVTKPATPRTQVHGVVGLVTGVFGRI